MNAESCLQTLSITKRFFNNATACFSEEHSGFVPVEGMFSTAQQVAHVAQTVEWFTRGAFSPNGFDMDFAAHEAQVRACTSLRDARAWLERAFQEAAEAFSADDETLEQPILDRQIFAGAPRFVIVGSIEEHTAHHRGSLAVYARLQGLVPAMPYE